MTLNKQETKRPDRYCDERVEIVQVRPHVPGTGNS